MKGTSDYLKKSFIIVFICVQDFKLGALTPQLNGYNWTQEEQGLSGSGDSQRQRLHICKSKEMLIMI